MTLASHCSSHIQIFFTLEFLKDSNTRKGKSVPIILRVLLLFIEQFSSIPKETKNWISVRIFHKDSKHQIIKSLPNSNQDHLAVFAIYPGTTPLDSVLRIVESLQKQKYSVLAVINKNRNSARFISALEEKQCAIMVRENIGADFGAYQSGIRYLKKIGLYTNLKFLVLVNDSIFVTPTSQQSITKISNPISELNCLFVHHQGISHAGSMFLKFDHQTLISKEFSRFWNRYFPYLNKRKIIFRGEHKLSKAVGIEKFHPIVDLDSINHIENYKLLNSEVVQLLTWSRKSSNLIHFYISKSIDVSNWIKVYSYTLSNLQVSNALGLNLSRVLQIPLKMDLMKLGLVSASDYLLLAGESGCMDDEVLELRKILNTKGGFLTDSLVKRTLKIYSMPGPNPSSRVSNRLYDDY